jgi:hypothetical protein
MPFHHCKPQQLWGERTRHSAYR